MARSDLSRIDAAKLTHINYAFALVNEGSEVYFRSPDVAGRHLAALNELKAKNPQLKVLLSIGGWGADHFSDAALTEASRARFAESAVALLTRHQLDGLDIDWEYPGHPGPGIKYRPEDKQNFTALLRELRQSLEAASARAGRTGSERYVLTIASSDGAYFQRTEMSLLHPYLDWINVMTYDRYGSWSATTGHHAGLFATRGAEHAPTVDSAVRQHLEAGIPREKIVVGAAFYGRAWSGVDRANHGLLQPHGKYLTGDFSYARLASEFIGRPDFEERWDAEAQSSYLWHSESGTFISYESPAALRAKAAYVRSHHLGGIMYWEQSDDPDNVLLSVLDAALTQRSGESLSPSRR